MPRYTVAYRHISTYLSLKEAMIGLHSYDRFRYVIAYNYGPTSNGKVFRCISHERCGRRLRVIEIDKEEAEIPVTFQLAGAGRHGTEISNRKKVGIDWSVKVEVDGLLTGGFRPKKCFINLKEKYAGQPAMLAKLPSESQIKNRLLTLRKHKRRVLEADPPTDSIWPTAASLDSLVAEEEALEEVNSSESEWVNDDRNSTIEVCHSREKQENVKETDRYDKEKLMTEFTALPGRPVLWRMLKTTEYTNEKSGTMMTEWITGQVIGWQTSESSPTKWVVQFTDGEKQSVELEELVDQIRASAQQGLNVTGQSLEF
ncbi:unnamed protein product [Peronospora farinosa]|uniref:Uncharacterized protein n=1 Tax=Peronospora farinosa TaxID=134698 RepID=A0AAV0SU01_9STRA|nr:unnamed protein product [Peronospora farinosa]CAI5707050.1 unnamed protein product [Peronospora farinosa]